MRALTKSESLLLSIFGAAILILLLLLGWQSLQRGLSGQRQRAAALQGQLDELQQWVGQEALWRTRGEWLAAHPLPLWQREASESGLVQDLQNSLAGASINIINQSLAGTEQFGDFFAVTVQLTLRATTEELVRWLHATQQPGEFIQIQQLNLRADNEPPNLRAEVRLTRYFHAGGLEASSAVPDALDALPPGEETAGTEEPSGTDAASPKVTATSPPTEAESLRPTEESDPFPTEAIPTTGEDFIPEPAAEPTAPLPPTPAPEVTPEEETADLPPAPVLPLDELSDDLPDDAFTETLPAAEDPATIELLPVPRPTPALRLDAAPNPGNNRPET
jgi:hypothetical protein